MKLIIEIKIFGCMGFINQKPIKLTKTLFLPSIAESFLIFYDDFLMQDIPLEVTRIMRASLRL